MKLFVYGTLKKGGCYHDRMNGTFLGEAVAHGWTMVDLGPYPAVVAGSGSVFGELYEVESLGALDPIEDYPRLYNRRIVPVFVGDEPHEAWIYFLEQSDAPVIEGGWWDIVSVSIPCAGEETEC
jgi:gamma-glutamylcyclotransferase (GGCT)/AIG2-like uncharacterized protein YtfP